MYEKTARARRLPLLRRRRARRGHHARASCSSATTRSSTRSAPRSTTGSGSRARTARARTPRREFVAWYNGHPHVADDDVRPVGASARSSSATATSRSTSRGCSCSTPTSSRSTDTADHAIDALAGGVGARRSSCSAAAGRRRRRSRTPSCASWASSRAPTSIVDPAELRARRRQRGVARDRGATRPRKRNVELLRDYAQRAARPRATDRRCASCARRSRSSARASDGPVTGVRVVRNRIERGEDGRCARSRPARRRSIDCGLVLRSIGYRGSAARRASRSTSAAA